MAALSEGTRPGAERREAVVMYAELRNFTRLSEVLDPVKVLSLTSAFFSLAARAVESHGGRVMDVHNDWLMAAFARGPRAQFAGQALDAAQELQREFVPVGERWQREYGLPAAVALGLHAGEVVLGAAGPLGAARPMAFGDCVTVAERLVRRARAGEIVFSGELLRLLEGSTDPDAEPLPPLELARRPGLPIYGILLDTRLDFT